MLLLENTQLELKVTVTINHVHMNTVGLFFFHTFYLHIYLGICKSIEFIFSYFQFSSLISLLQRYICVYLSTKIYF
jgi:hypothetical protein